MKLLERSIFTVSVANCHKRCTVFKKHKINSTRKSNSSEWPYISIYFFGEDWAITIVAFPPAAISVGNAPDKLHKINKTETKANYSTRPFFYMYVFVGEQPPRSEHPIRCNLMGTVYITTSMSLDSSLHWISARYTKSRLSAGLLARLLYKCICQPAMRQMQR